MRTQIVYATQELLSYDDAVDEAGYNTMPIHAGGGAASRDEYCKTQV